MTDHDEDTKNWRSKQDWFKTVLSKSGTELMEISKHPVANTAQQLMASTSANATLITTTTTKNNNRQTAGATGAAARSSKGTASKRNAPKESPAKMVYYQSTPLIVKSEPQHKAAQFCAPLQTSSTQAQTATTSSSNALAQPLLHGTQTYGLSQNGTLLLLPQQQTLQQPGGALTTTTTTTSINLANFKPDLRYANIGSSSPPNSTNITTLVTLAAPSGRKTATATPAQKPQFKCEQCGMTFGSKSAHTSHTKSHAKNNAANGINGELVGDATSLDLVEASGIPKMPQIKPNAGANGANGGDPYQCNVCQKTFAVPARLIRHYRTHTGERPFECEFCHKLFSVKENLQVHRRIHTKERPYKCDVCGRAFEHSGKLHRHMRIHTGERPHKCSVCDKTFIQSGQLVIHMRTHTGEKPYKCPVEGCGKGFTCSKQLKVHSRTHTGEKPYHCDICFRDFGYNHVLKLHRVQHYGSKCYKCTICDETFKSKKEMEAHIKGHANELPDDEEEAGDGTTAATSTGSSSSLVSSAADSSNSAPCSPHSPASSNVTPTAAAARPAVASSGRKNNNRRGKKVNAAATVVAPCSPGSPRCTLSPPSSLASSVGSSVDSPCSISIASPASALLTLETDHYSRDSGVASNATIAAMQHSTNSNNTNTNTATGNSARLSVASAPMESGSILQSAMYALVEDDMPTDLSIPQAQLQPSSAQHYYTTTATPAEYHGYAEQHLQQQPQHEAPTINPALLEAASIASRREKDVTEAAAALQIMQRNQQQQPQVKAAPAPPVQQASVQQHHSPSSARPAVVMSDVPHYDDTREANELIEHYKRGELARHGGIHKGGTFAPAVPKFESSLRNNEIIVRQVEAALVGLRSSTESPERSSSPESDTMILMAERDVMTLPLRKRKLYMNKGPIEGVADCAMAPVGVAEHNSNNGISAEQCVGVTAGVGGVGSEALDAPLPNKVMRKSSVIQFAKAS